MDIANSFTTAFADAGEMTKKPQRGGNDGKSFAYPTFDMCNKHNRGMVVGRLFLDSLGSPFRLIKDSANQRVPYTYENADGTTGQGSRTIKWIGNGNFSEELTAEQTKANDELITLMWAYSKIDEKAYVQQAAWLYLTYIAISKTLVVDEKGTPTVSNEYVEPCATLCIHRSKAFGAALQNAVTQKSAIEGNDWMSDYFGRAPGKASKFVNIKSVLKPEGSIGYDISVTLIDNYPKPLEVTPDILNNTLDLNKEYVPREFPMEAVQESILLLKDLIGAQSTVNADTNDYIPPSANANIPSEESKAESTPEPAKEEPKAEEPKASAETSNAGEQPPAGNTSEPKLDADGLPEDTPF